MKPYFNDERAQLWLGDFTEVSKHIEPESVDLIFTSPRYNANIEYAEGIVDFTSSEEYLNEIIDHILKMYDLMKPGAHLGMVTPPYIRISKDENWEGNYKVEPYLSQIITKIYDTDFADDPLWFIGIKPWIKQGLKDFQFTSVGSMYNRPSLPVMWECITFFRKGFKDRNGLKGKTPNEEFMKDMAYPWYMSGETATQKLEHPTPFPAEIVRRVIRGFTRKGEVIMDPYVGSGTTAKVALKMGRYFIGCDIVEKYVKKTINRCRLDHVTIW